MTGFPQETVQLPTTCTATLITATHYEYDRPSPGNSPVTNNMHSDTDTNSSL